jgi:hypothetical protein
MQTLSAEVNTATRYVAPPPHHLATHFNLSHISISN